jgi:regulator of cell morphogenesis and NO signaling
MENMELSENTKVSEVINFNFKTTEIFEKHGIEFCCGGKKSLSQACSNKNISLDDLLNELKAFSYDNDIVNEWAPDFLIDYIINVHHLYLKKYLPKINEHVKTVTAKHSGKFPEVIDLAYEFDELKKELEDHMRKEETILFPYIKTLAGIESGKSEFTVPPFGSIDNPISVMEREHAEAGNSLENIKRLTNNFTVEDSYCNTHRITYYELEDLYKDLHRHINLENNLLFPKGKMLEEKFSASLNDSHNVLCSCAL